jgi:Glycosyl transferase family 2
MTVCLAMIIRDEAENLVRCLAAAAKIVDKVVLVDTGSEDDTLEVAREWAARTGVALVIHEEPWQNFRENRTSLLRHAEREADWILMLDADLVIHAPSPLPLEPADCWQGRVSFAGLSYTLPFLIRSGKPWRYEGVAHSYLACDEEFDEAEMAGLWVEDYSHTSQEKIARDLELLSAEHARKPLDRRTVFYLAQSYYDLDRFEEAIHYYRMRAEMGGWDEEVYFARYRLGCMLAEHVSFAQGAKELLRAWEERPGRVEALRALAGSATSVANKLPVPADRLFLGTGSYGPHEISAAPAAPALEGSTQQHWRKAKPRSDQMRRHTPAPLTPEHVSAILVTRGNVDMQPILETLPFPDVVVWDNSQRENLGPFGRYAAIREAKNAVIYWQDDDIVFDRFDDLLAAYQKGRYVSNMDAGWIAGAGYGDFVSMQGAGSICDADLPWRVFDRYARHHPDDWDFLIEADFVFGVLAPFVRVDLGYQTRAFTDDPDRLYTQPWQTAKKWAAIERCREIIRTDGPIGWPAEEAA